MNRVKCYVLVLLLLFTMTGCGKQAAAPKLKTPASESIQSVKAVCKDIVKEEIVVGYVTGSFSGCYYTSTKENVSYPVALGDKVVKGQVVAVSDTSEYDEQLKQLQEQLSAEKEDISYQKKHLTLEIKQKKEQKNESDDRMRDVVETEIQRLQADLEYQKQVSDIRIQQLNQEIECVKGQIEDNTLRATADGHVAYMSYAATVQAMENAVMISRDDDYYIALQDELSNRARNFFVRAYTTYLGSEQELENIPYSEKEQRIALRNNMKLTPRFALKNDAIHLGDYLDVHIVLDESTNAVTVPSCCVYTGQESSYIYKIVDGRKEKCIVKQGISDGVDTEILEGLDVGEEVYYPVETELEYSGTETVKKSAISLFADENRIKKEYPRLVDVTSGVGEAKLLSATDQTEVKQGDVLATLEVTSGKADVTDVENQLASLKRQYEQQKKAQKDSIKQMTKQLKQQGKKSSVELSLAELEQTYKEKVYHRQQNTLERALSAQKKITGTVAVTAPCSGTYRGMYEAGREHIIVNSNDYIGTVTDDSISYYVTGNNAYKYHYGDRVKVNDTYEGTVVGAFSSATQEMEYTGADGQAVYYISEPQEQMTKAYIQLDQPVEDLKEGSVSIVSNPISDVFVVEQEDIKKGEDDSRYVWTLKDGKPYKQYVRCLRGSNNQYWVFGGLAEGDVLLTGVK